MTEFNTATCPVCMFGPNDCRCGYDPNMTITVSGSTDGLDLPLEWTEAKAIEWDGPIVLNSPRFVEPKAQKCPVCEGDGKRVKPSFDSNELNIPLLIDCHGCEGKGWVTV